MNAGITYQAFYQPRVFSSRKFQLTLIEQLLDGYKRTSNRPGRRSQDDHDPLSLHARLAKRQCFHVLRDTTPSGCTELNAQKNCMSNNLLDCKVFRGKINRHRVK